MKSRLHPNQFYEEPPTTIVIVTNAAEGTWGRKEMKASRRTLGGWVGVLFWAFSTARPDFANGPGGGLRAQCPLPNANVPEAPHAGLHVRFRFRCAEGGGGGGEGIRVRALG